MSVDSSLTPNSDFASAEPSLVPRVGAIMAAFVAMLSVYFFRANHSPSVVKVIFETVLFASLPLIALFIIQRRILPSNLLKIPKPTLFRFQSGAILTGIFVIAWHTVCRYLGFGSAYEIIALLTIQNIGWYLAIFSKLRGFEKTSFVLCSFTAFFVCCVTDQPEIFVITGIYAFASLWWLLGQYWNQLDTKTIDGRSRSLPLHGGAISITTIVVGAAACLAAAIPFSQSRVSLVGFMPFSGGQEGYDDLFANSGIGDGNMLAAGNNATTTGAVESDQIIEGHEKSLYDAVSEQYNGPVKKRRRGKAVGLSSVAKHLDNAKQSEQSGKTFRTMRNTDKKIDRDYENRITEALFFVEGSAPARFTVNAFDHFDGWDWSRTADATNEYQRSTFTLDQSSGPDVFRIDQQDAAYLTDYRWHCVKIMRLETDVVPAPAFLKRWRIPQVNRPDMYQWNDAGLLRMDTESIPSQTMIFTQSQVPNYHLLRACQHQMTPSESPFLQTPLDDTSVDIHAKVQTWTAKTARGWEQVEAIVEHLRGDFKLKPSWNVNREAESSVDEFFKQGGGPSYMFATSCVIALRSAGFKTRLTSGFLVRKSDYDSQANQSIVTSENLHMWPEVCIDGISWIPVEPTPGYPVPYSTQTIWQWLTTQASKGVALLISHPITTLLSALAIWLGVAFRARFVTSLMLIWWTLVRWFWPAGLLKATCQLIDLRFWFAGDRRPNSATVPAWYARVEPEQAGQFFELWNAKNYSDSAQNISTADLIRSCQNSINSLTLTRIRDFAMLAKKDTNP